MASIYKRGNVWRVQIHIKGERLAQSFRTKSEAKQWAEAEEERLIYQGQKTVPYTIGQMLEKYRDEVTPTHRGAKFELRRIKWFLEQDIAAIRLDRLTRRHLTEWRDQSLRTRQPNTVRRDMTLLRAVFTTASLEWMWLKENPMRFLRPPAPPPARTRLPNRGEIDAIVKASGYSPNRIPETIRERVGAAFLFAIQTGLREGEIALLDASLDRGNHIYLPEGKTKNGLARNVALTPEARRILTQVGSSFDLTADQIGNNYRRIRDQIAKKDKRMVEIKTLRFHDLRAYALTKLAEQLHPMELAKLSGHKDMKILLNTYYRNDVDDTANKLKDVVI
jgi:integrase